METETNPSVPPNAPDSSPVPLQPDVQMIPAKKSNGMLIVIAIIVILLVLGGSYYALGMNQKSTQAPETTIEQTDRMIYEEPSAENEPPPVSSSDEINAIEQDLNSTTLTDDSALYTDVQTDLNGL